MTTKKEMGTVLIGEAEVGLQIGVVTAGDLLVPMVEAGRGVALTMVAVPAHTASQSEGIALIMEEKEVLHMIGIAG